MNDRSLCPFPTVTSADPLELERLRAELTGTAAALEKIEDALAGVVSDFGALALAATVPGTQGGSVASLASLTAKALEQLESVLSSEDGSLPWAGAQLAVLAQFLWPTEEERQKARESEASRIMRKALGAASTQRH